MIEFNGNHRKCLDCGHEWDSTRHTHRCANCGVPADRYRRTKQYSSKEDNIAINITPELRERLLRRRVEPYEPLISVVDRLQTNSVNMEVKYTHKKLLLSLAITRKAHDNMTELKWQYRIRSYNEMLWRLM